MTRQRPILAAVFAAVLAASLLSPQAALAAANRISYYDVRSVRVSDGSRGLLVAAELAQSVPLPAEVRLPVPKGAKVDWVGEILGGDPSKDPTAKYRSEAGGSDYDVLVVTVTQARRAQAEVSVAAPITGADGTRLGISWQAPEAADGAQLAIEVPSGAKVTSATVGATPTQAGGSTFYVKQFGPPAKGTRLGLSLVYTGGTTSGAGQQTPQQQTPQTPQQQTPAQAPSSGVPGGVPASPFAVVIVLALILGITFFALDRVRPRAEAPAVDTAAASRSNRNKH